MIIMIAVFDSEDDDDDDDEGQKEAIKVAKVNTTRVIRQSEKRNTVINVVKRVQ